MSNEAFIRNIITELTVIILVAANLLLLILLIAFAACTVRGIFILP